MNHQLNIGPTLNHQVGLMLDQCWGSVMNEIPTLGQYWAKHHTRGQCQIPNSLTLGQHQANLLVERWADEQDDVGPMVKTDNGPTQYSTLGLRWPNVSLLSGSMA